jgi:hypothetical protein
MANVKRAMTGVTVTNVLRIKVTGIFLKAAFSCFSVSRPVKIRSPTSPGSDPQSLTYEN